MICPHCGSETKDPVEAQAEEPVQDHDPTAVSGYRVDVEIGGEIVRFFGPCGNLRARVFRGTITRQVFNALKSIESPAMKAYFIGDVTVKMPRVFESLNNQGKDRRFVAFYGQGSGNLVLEFLGGDTISRDLEYVIRGAFPSKNSSPEEEDKEPENERGTESSEPAERSREEERDDSSGGQESSGQGDDPEHGDAPERTEDGQVLEQYVGMTEEEINAKVEAVRSFALAQQAKSSKAPPPFTTIRKGGPMKNPPKKMYYRRPKGL